MSKKTKKKKKPEPSGFGVIKPSFQEVWRQAVDGIKTLEEDHSEKYWSRAAEEKYAPLLFPRRKRSNWNMRKNLKRKAYGFLTQLDLPFSMANSTKKKSRAFIGL